MIEVFFAFGILCSCVIVIECVCACAYAYVRMRVCVCACLRIVGVFWCACLCVRKDMRKGHVVVCRRRTRAWTIRIWCVVV